MKKYEYKFIEVQGRMGLGAKSGYAFEECKKIIISEAEAGWRLKQIVTPFNEKVTVHSALGYQIVFEREV